MRTPTDIFEAASALAADGKLWSAADTLMAGFADLGDAADAPNADSLGRPIRGSAPKLMDRAADYLDLLDTLEADDPDAIDAEVAAATPPRHMRWAQWHALNGQAEVRRGHPGRAVDHLELSAGLFGSDGMRAQEIPLLAQISLCQLECGDVPRAEDALNRALTAKAALGASDPAAAAKFAGLLDDVAARITAELRP
ncbi:hypothetical protein [Corynebacterium freneyi]|uniref:Tetratricopeptide repeat protein n=1 Tax=Corynebacterium freneyi TaxID=134034 RepID=A0ABS4U7X5_9CORY|nr:hypothetical protein [Corynebacterium freneyi]MBP2332300.1 hypothetical protein [Corynebacterium freneyi]QXA53488.1 hypothetical protein I6L56_03735 [Corynebacterium freneyi]WJZ05590.1 hypothetical protein CFREN_08145 [Corynebacterium freneyi]